MIDSQGIPLVQSERRDTGYMREGDGWGLRICWAEAREAEPALDRPALPAGWVLPGGERTINKEYVLRWCESVCKSLAGY